MFEDTETLARINYLVDVSRGNLPNIPFDEYEHRDIYMREAEECDYILTLEDMKLIEALVIRGSKP